jgi:hypothetical protein
MMVHRVLVEDYWENKGMKARTTLWHVDPTLCGVIEKNQ